ncbi:MAG: insulinase family protein [Lachnospiraceae bacterium]|nr:insulinase family protein [Lachnospiraceae bacterium]
MAFDAYEFLKTQNLPGIGSVGTLYRHKKSGARVVTIANDDENKVFYIGFRTPPTDSTGVAHIIEHTVLCGSEKFPLKDPFMELAKGSLNTFLNAITYPDKTIYPVASCNDKDFRNLMDVYLDAVFHPNIYKEEKIFRQEGWHYELTEQGELIYNGVVYNEMKGDYSSPETVAGRLAMEGLYPDTCYGVESGGDPEHIPDLTYEDYLNFHRRYYHPSNSYIFIYGNMDMEETLAWMDEAYLSTFTYAPVNSEIQVQPAFDQMRVVQGNYPVSAESDGKDQTYLSYNVMIKDKPDALLTVAMDVLDYAILGMPGAPLQQALLDAGIGKDISGGYTSSLRQSNYEIDVKGANPEQADDFVKCIRETLTKLCEEGINKQSLLAALSIFEFKYREAEYGYPKGLLYGIKALDSWLYDDDAPFDRMDLGDIYGELRDLAKTDYFEQLIRKYFLENAHAAVVVLAPEAGLQAKNDAKLREKLEAYKASLSEEELKGIVDFQEALWAYQQAPDAPEDKEKIPLLRREDINPKARPLSNELIEDHILFHDHFSNGIAYVDLLFDITDMAEEDLPYTGLLTDALGIMDTAKHGYEDLNNEINIHTGGLTTSIGLYPKNQQEFSMKMMLSLRTLLSEKEQAFGLAKEILNETDYSDLKRLKEVLEEIRYRMQDEFDRAGNAVAVKRANAYLTESAAVNDKMGGVDYYRFICDLLTKDDTALKGVAERLQKLANRLFDPEKLLISVTCGREMLDDVLPDLRALKNAFGVQDTFAKKTAPVTISHHNEGFTTAGQVQYVVRVGRYGQVIPYNGVFHVLRSILSMTYLWDNVRVKGGAYGCSAGFGRTGIGYFSSYRDPNLEETNKVYEKAADFVASYDCSDREMTRNIIGTFGGLDAPLGAAALGGRDLGFYLTGVTYETLQKERDELLAATQADVRALAPAVRAICAENVICVVGNEEKIEKAKDLFDETCKLSVE